jgi:hypothetical protein
MPPGSQWSHWINCSGFQLLIYGLRLKFAGVEAVARKATVVCGEVNVVWIRRCNNPAECAIRSHKNTVALPTGLDPKQHHLMPWP